MIRYECDRCGVSMGANDARRYIVKIEIYAAAGHVELSEEQLTDPAGELAKVLADLASADPDEIEDQTYWALRFDVCNTCRRELQRDPLGRKPG